MQNRKIKKNCDPDPRKVGFRLISRWNHTPVQAHVSLEEAATATAGTIFDKTRTPLTTWFEAAWHVTTAKNGLSAKTLERTLGTHYRAAWTMLQRFRVAMVRSERERLSGVVEVDETLIGGVEHGGKRGRGTTKAVVVVAVEVLEPKGFGRLRMRHIPDASGANLVPFVCDVVATGAVIHTDAWGGYNDLPKHGYTRARRSCLLRPTLRT